MTAIFVFTRDLRLEDNIPLIAALKTHKNVLPIFIFDPKQITKTNKYKSDNCIQFMMECLDELNNELKQFNSRMFYFYGHTIDILKDIINDSKINSIYISMDYTPFALKRSKDIGILCKNKKINFVCMENHMLNNVNTIAKNDGNFYKMFTPYKNAAMKMEIAEPIKNKFTNYIKKSTKYDFEFTDDIHDLYEKNENLLVHGGRSNALKILKNIKKYNGYNNDREIPSISGTTFLSAYLKFNVVSIREVYKIFNKNLNGKNKLLTQLYWRDFYMMIMYHYCPLKNNRTYDIEWNNNAKMIKCWKTGTTGIPIIDAAMNQMNTIGWMHNRCRMIVSNFFIKVMGCDWAIGEQYFAQMLVDYDVCNNNGGWNWSAGAFSGFDFSVDAQPYFRVFNPWRQMKMYDPECIYIKKWLPQLKNVPNNDILNWNDTWKNYKKIKYPKPMIDDIQKEFTKTLKYLK